MSAVPVIDLNADVGEREGAEWIAEDLTILAGISSANVACGFHAGDARTMRAICDEAVARHVRIGAHISYADRAGFGRRDRNVDPASLRDQSLYQLGALSAIAAAAGGLVTYVKPHGALYNRCAVDVTQATAVTDAIIAFDSSLALLGPPRSALLEVAASYGIRTVTEGFADRAYLPDRRLMPRDRPGSVLDPRSALAQASQIVVQQTVTASDGRPVALHVRSLCLHSDTPGAAELARALRSGLLRAGVEISAFT